MVNLWIIYGSGWWLTYPAEKYESIGRIISNLWKKKTCSKPPTRHGWKWWLYKIPIWCTPESHVLGKSLGDFSGVLAFLRLTSWCLTLLTFCEFGCDLGSHIFEPLKWLKWVRVISPWHLIVTFQLTQKY